MQSDLAYRQNWMCDSTRMTDSSVGKEWPIGRNHSFPHLIIEVFEANNRVTADGDYQISGEGQSPNIGGLQ